MIPIKTPQQIKVMTMSGAILTRVFSEVIQHLQPGVRLIDLDQIAEKLIRKSGAQPSFQMVDDYRYTTCLNINDGIVHGVPNLYQILDGDVVTLDLGVYYQGFHTDMARTFQVRNQRPKTKDKRQKEIEKFLQIGRLALENATHQAISGHRVGYISQSIQQTVETAGYQVVRTLSGHGVGLKLHEPPTLYCYLKDSLAKTPLLHPGMTLAIEVIYTQGSPDLILDSQDGWTLSTADHKLSGLFENTILVTHDQPLVLTDLEKFHFFSLSSR